MDKQFKAIWSAESEDDTLTLYDASGKRVLDDDGKVIEISDRTIWRAFESWMDKVDGDGDYDAFTHTCSYVDAQDAAIEKMHDKLIALAARNGISEEEIEF